MSSAGGPVDFAFGPIDGALYYVAIFSGEVRRVAVAPPSDVDAYLCYKAALARGETPLPKGTTVSLSDAIVAGPQSFDVAKATTICNPASVSASSVIGSRARTRRASR